MKKIYKISIGVILALLLVVALSINTIIKNILIDTARERTGLDVSIGSLWMNPFSGKIKSRDIIIREKEKELFTLKSFLLESSPLDIMRGNLYIDEITLIEPVIDISPKDVKEEEAVVEDSSQTEEGPAPQQTTATTPSEVPLEKVSQKEDDQTSFIKEVIVKNINVENLTLKGRETVLKSLNTLSLKVPDFTFRDDKLTLKASLDVTGTGTLDVALSADTETGALDMTLGSPALVLNNSLETPLGTLILKGNFSGDTDLQGNYKDKIFTLKGEGDFKDFIVSDTENNSIISMDNLKASITKVSYPDMLIEANGSYSLTGGEHLIPFLLKGKEDISGTLSEAFLTGSFTVASPLITTTPALKINGLKMDLQGGTSLTSDSLQGEYYLTYDLDSREYIISGDTSSVGTGYTSSDATFDGDLDLILDHIKPEDIRISQLDIKNGRASFKGDSITDLSLNLKDFTPTTLDSPLKVAATYAGAPFTADLHLKSANITDPSALSLKGNISLKGLDLDSVKKYTEGLPYDLGGVLSYAGSVDYAEDKIATRGNFSSTDFSVKDEKVLDIVADSLSGRINFSRLGDNTTLKDTTLDFTGVSGVPAEGIDISLPKGSLALTSYDPEDIVLSLLSLTSPDIKVVATEDTQVALIPSVKVSSLPLIEKVAYAQEIQAAPAPKEPLPNISVKDLKISRGRISQTKGGDTLVIDSINLQAKDFTTKKGSPFTLDASASLEGIDSLYVKGTSTLREDWGFDPKTIAFKGDLGIRKLYLPDFNDKFAKSLPNKIKRGMVNSSGNLSLDSGKVSSRSKLVISDLELGQATGIASRVPLDRVVDALKDDNGDINVTVPVDGDLNDPDFGVEKVVLEILMANFTEILKSPEKAVSSIISIGSSDKDNVVYFDYLETTPKADDLPKLDEFIDLLKNDAASKIKVTIFTNDKVEKGLIKTQDIAGILFGGKKSSSSDDLDEIMEARKKYIYDYLTKYIDATRIEIIISDRDKSLPQAKLEVVK